MQPHPTRRDPWPWVGLACALAFIALAVLVVRRGGLAFDEPLAAALQALPIPVWFWEACTFLGGVILIPIGVAFVLAAALTRRVKLAIIVAVVLIVGALFTDLVKDFVGRPRPSVNQLVAAAGYSFPSGHTLNSTVTYGLLALVAWRSGLPIAVRRAAIAVGVVVPILVGLSRIALGVHYPTDVLAGWLVGVALVAVAATLIRATGAMERDWPGRPAPGPSTGP
jgi:membrane-associated phospholipid phosphatase